MSSELRIEKGKLERGLQRKEDTIAKQENKIKKQADKIVNYLENLKILREQFLQMAKKSEFARQD